jgi:hypothetical protein
MCKTRVRVPTPHHVSVNLPLSIFEFILSLAIVDGIGASAFVVGARV